MRVKIYLNGSREPFHNKIWGQYRKSHKFILNTSTYTERTDKVIQLEWEQIIQHCFITSFISKDLLFFINFSPFHIEKGKYALLKYTACSTKPIETLIYSESSMKWATRNMELHLFPGLGQILEEICKKNCYK